MTPRLETTKMIMGSVLVSLPTTKMGRKRKDEQQSGIRKRKRTDDGESGAMTPRLETTKMIMGYTEEFHVSRLKGLKECLDSALLNDFTLLIGPKRKAFHVNRFPLATVSPVIKQHLATLTA